MHAWHASKIIYLIRFFSVCYSAMSGTPTPKKEPDPTLSARVEPSIFRGFHTAVKRMRRKPTDVIEELARAFMEYTKDGRTPNFPLVVSAESYRAPDGRIVVEVSGPPEPASQAQLNRIEAFAAEAVRLISEAEVVKSLGASLRDAKSPSPKQPRPPASGPGSTHTEHR